MATKVIVALEDDLEGGPAAETLRFGLAGSEYEIDLNEKNAARLRKQLAPFVEHARRAGRAQRRAVRTAASRRRSRDIRSWAQDHGIELSERGRIPASVVDQYEAAVRRSSRLSAAGNRGWARDRGVPGILGSDPGGGLLLVTAELFAHRGQRLVREQVELARGEP
jgi:hypothetical protein